MKIIIFLLVIFITSIGLELILNAQNNNYFPFLETKIYVMEGMFKIKDYENESDLNGKEDNEVFFILDEGARSQTIIFLGTFNEIQKLVSFPREMKTKFLLNGRYARVKIQIKERCIYDCPMAKLLEIIRKLDPSEYPVSLFLIKQQ